MHGWDVGVLIILGLAVFGGVLGASLFQKLRIPQVVGYIVTGLILGETGLGIVSTKDVDSLSNLNMFALAIIGFMVGGELKKEQFQKYGKQFLAILLGEGLTAFAGVFLFTGMVVFLVTHEILPALAAGIVLGAIASATDPASTIEVLWEYRTRGVLTSTLVAIVALDDALAMTLYGIATGVAEILSGTGGAVGAEVAKVGIELAGAVALGGVGALLLIYILRFLHVPEKVLAIAIGTILLLMGVAVKTDLDVILAAMTMGLVLTNVIPRRSHELFAVVRSFATPIYVLFFVLVGARLSISNMPMWMWALVAVYLIGRNGGKIIGALFGARISHAEPPVQKYSGLGLFAQGGVSVGLAIMASQHLGHLRVTDTLSLGDMVIFSVTATTLFTQVFGPPIIKWAAQRAGEVGRNVTEDDVIDTLKVSDVMDTDVTPIDEHIPLTRVFEVLTSHDQLIYPIISNDDELVGMMAFEGLKDVVANQDTWPWLVAADVKLPISDKTTSSSMLKNALEHMRDVGIEQMLVVETEDAHKPAGILDLRLARRRINEELLKRQQSAAA